MGASQRKLLTGLTFTCLLLPAIAPTKAAAAGLPTPALAEATPAPEPNTPANAEEPNTGSALPAAPPPPTADAGSLPPAPPPHRSPASSRPGAGGSDLPALPPPAPGVRLHDGFYLRLALGLGASGALVSTDAQSVPNSSFTGSGGSVDLWLGGTPIPGLALGGALCALSVNSSTRRIGGESRSGDVSGSTGLLGVFADGFPDPKRGFHFGGTVGLASGHTEVAAAKADAFNGGGVGLATWLGYDMWVSPQWSLGGMVRFLGSLTRETRADVNYQTSIGGVTLSFTALYH